MFVVAAIVGHGHFYGYIVFFIAAFYKQRGRNQGNTTGIGIQHLYKFYKGTQQTITDEDLYEFEIEMALNYLEVFYWYYYYLTGYYVRGTVTEPYYRYSHAPMYNSLLVVLRYCPDEEKLKFDRMLDRTAELVRITHEYYYSLRSYKQLHHYITMPAEEYNREYPDSSLNVSKINQIKTSIVKADDTFVTRDRARILFIEKPDIEAIINDNRQYVTSVSKTDDKVSTEPMSKALTVRLEEVRTFKR